MERQCPQTSNLRSHPPSRSSALEPLFLEIYSTLTTALDMALIAWTLRAYAPRVIECSFSLVVLSISLLPSLKELFGYPAGPRLGSQLVYHSPCHFLSQ